MQGVGTIARGRVIRALSGRMLPRPWNLLIQAALNVAALPAFIRREALRFAASWLTPVDPTTCRPVLPHAQLRVNTVFEVARQHGLRTAWSDKHAAYDVLQGPSGTGIQDLFTPEINSDTGAGTDWTGDNGKTQQYDGYKVTAVLNEIDGYDQQPLPAGGDPRAVRDELPVRLDRREAARVRRPAWRLPGRRGHSGSRPGEHAGVRRRCVCSKRAEHQTGQGRRPTIVLPGQEQPCRP
jgi:hypothetical protein